MNKEREQSLKEALKSIEKQYGKGSVMVLGDNVPTVAPLVAETSIVYAASLDTALNESVTSVASVRLVS